MKRYKKYSFKQSKEWHWYTDKTLDWIIDNTAFMFYSKGHNGSRPHLVLKESLLDAEGESKMDLIILSNDRWGIRMSAVGTYGLEWEINIAKIYFPSDIRYELVRYFTETLCEDFINPKSFRTIIRIILRRIRIIVSNL